MILACLDAMQVSQTEYRQMSHRLILRRYFPVIGGQGCSGFVFINKNVNNDETIVCAKYKLQCIHKKYNGRQSFSIDRNIIEWCEHFWYIVVTCNHLVLTSEILGRANLCLTISWSHKKYMFIFQRNSGRNNYVE